MIIYSKKKKARFYRADYFAVCWFENGEYGRVEGESWIEPKAAPHLNFPNKAFWCVLCDKNCATCFEIEKRSKSYKNSQICRKNVAIVVGERLL